MLYLCLSPRGVFLCSLWNTNTVFDIKKKKKVFVSSVIFSKLGFHEDYIKISEYYVNG